MTNKVLLVLPCWEVRLDASEAFRGLGWCPVACSDIAEATRCLVEQFDLVVVDGSLGPHNEGWAYALKLQRTMPHQRVVVLSSTANPPIGCQSVPFVLKVGDFGKVCQVLAEQFVA